MSHDEKASPQTREFEVTADVYKRLKARYEQATSSGEASFVFDGHELLTAYAKYLLEYLAPKFEVK